jgi:two-component system nitrogen regulation response regulator NtrX
MLEEELFGEEDNLGRVIKIGIFEQANNGTLFIDEVSDLTMEAQAFFVKALQDNTIRRKNGSTRINVDVRVISSTSVQINEKIKNKEFSEDLYYRLNVIPIEMPALSNRKEDIPVLINYFLNKASNFSGRNKLTIDQQSLSSLQVFNWEGNVSQLKNAIERILIMIDDASINEITYDMLPKDLLNIEKKKDDDYNRDYLYSLNLKNARIIFEHDYITKNLDRFNGNITKTANFIGMERSAFHRKLNTLKQLKRQK